MKRFIAFFASSIFGALLVGQLVLQPAFAAPSDPYGLNATAMRTPFAQSVSSGKKLPQLIGDIISVALSLVGIIFLVLAVYGGFKWMTAQGNEDQVHDARQTIVDATIGIILIVAAYSITNFIFTNVIAPIAGDGLPSDTVQTDPTAVGNGAGAGGPTDIQQNSYACKFDDGFGGGCSLIYAMTNSEADGKCKQVDATGIVSAGACPSVVPPSKKDYCCTYIGSGLKVPSMQPINATAADAKTQCDSFGKNGGTTVSDSPVPGKCTDLSKDYCCSGDDLSNSTKTIQAPSQNDATSACIALGKWTTATPKACNFQ